MTLLVRAVVLAASCGYLRGLWAGGFSEAVSNGVKASVSVDGGSASASAKKLVNLLYGDEVKVTLAEALQLHCFADAWQCESVVTLTAKKKAIAAWVFEPTKLYGRALCAL